MNDTPDARAIFEGAIEKAPEKLNAFLDDACGDDFALRQEVEALLRSHREAGNFLEASESRIAPTLDQIPAAGSDDAETPFTEGPGTQIGPYKLLQEIGQGGMGVVYMAEQREPVKRQVALKIIKPGMDTRQVIARFEAERQALALMDHPHIARVLDAGATESGRPYFVMELVHGIPISKYCDQKQLTLAERLSLFIPVCKAVQHAHQKGIVHRDLKPGNVLVTRYDERPVPKVIDFGIAKATGQTLTDKTMFTQFGQVVGTLEYMSPEQAEPNQLDIDTRSDIYSLGVMLYELLTGTTPHERKRLLSSAFDEMLRIIREEEPPRPSMRLSTTDTIESVAAHRRIEPKKLTALVRRELDWIVMKALEKDRARRYETANGFAEDIERYLNNEAVVACSPSAGYRLRKFARRNKAVLTIAGVITAALVFGLAGTTSQWLRAEKETERADKQRDNALDAERRAKNDRDLAQTERKKAERLAASESQARGELETELRRSTARELAGQSSAVRAAAPTRSLLLGIAAIEATRQHGEPVVPVAHENLLNAVLNAGGTPLAGHRDIVLSMKMSPDGRWLATASFDKTVRLWDLEADDPKSSSFVLRGHQRTPAFMFSGDGRRLVTHSAFDRGFNVWDLRQENPADSSLVVTGHEGSVSGLPRGFSISPDGRWLVAAGTNDQDALLWDLDANDPLAARPLTLASGRGRYFAFTPDSASLVSVSGTTAQLWDLSAGDTPSEVSQFDVGERPRAGDAARLLFSSDGRWMVAAGQVSATLWDLAGDDVTGRSRTFSHESLLPAVKTHITADDRWVCAWGDKTIQLWDLSSEELQTDGLLIENGSTVVSAVASSAAGRWLAAGYTDGTVLVFDLNAADIKSSRKLLQAHRDRVYALAFSPDERHLSSGGGDREVRLWDLSGEASSLTSEILRGHDAMVHSLVFTNDNRWLISQAADVAPRIWDLKASSAASPLRLRGAGRVKATGNQKMVTVSRSDVRLWNMGGSHPVTVTPLPNHPLTLDGIRTVAFGAQGRWLSMVDDELARLWDLAASNPFRAPREFHHEFVQTVAISPDSRWLVTGGGPSLGDRQQPVSGQVRLWDLAAEEPADSPTQLPEHQYTVTRLAIGPDSRWLATADHSNVRLWDLAAADPTVAPVLERSFGSIGLRSVSISPDGRWLAVGGTDGFVHVWELTSGAPSSVPTKLRHASGLTQPDHIWLNLWSQDGYRLVTAGDLGVVFVWDFEHGLPEQPRHVLRSHDSSSRNSIRSGALSHDGRWLATLGDAALGQAVLWDLQADSPASSARGAGPIGQRLNSVAFSQDDRWLITGGQDVTLMHLDIDALIGQARQIAGRSLTPAERRQYRLEVRPPSVRQQATAANVGGLRQVAQASGDNLQGVDRVAVSPDGRFLYAATWRADTISVWERDPDSGELSHVQDLTAGDNLDGAVALRLSPDGGHAVATAFNSDAVVLYSRDPETGTLSQLDVAKDGTNNVDMRQPMDAAFSPDSRFVYVIDSEGPRRPDRSKAGSLLVFRITANELELVETNTGTDRCFANARGVSMRPDGSSLVVTSSAAGTLVVLRRDEDTGKTSVEQILKDGTGGISALGGAMSVAHSPDGNYVYVTAGLFRGDHAVSVYRYNEAGQLELVQEILHADPAFREFEGGNEIRVSPDGRHVYAVGSISSSLASFERDSTTGRLTLIEILNREQDGNSTGLGGLGLSPDGQFVYVTQGAVRQIAVFRRVE